MLLQLVAPRGAGSCLISRDRCQDAAPRPGPKARPCAVPGRERDYIIPPMPPCRPCHPWPGHDRRRRLPRACRQQRLGGEEQGGDRRRVLQRRASDLGRVDDAGLEEVLELAGGGVEAVAPVSPTTCCTTHDPSWPAFSAISRAGAVRGWGHDAAPVFSSPSSFGHDGLDVPGPGGGRCLHRRRCPPRRQHASRKRNPRCGASSL